MQLWLPQKLKPYQELYREFENIRKVCEDIWRNKLMVWFTNHDTRHSEEILYILGRILKPIESYEDDFLNNHELFVLTTSAYLHDIGMQNLRLNNISIDALSEKDYDEIRKRHANESFNIIMSKRMGTEFYLPNIDNDYNHLLALVSKGHSSDYFDEIIKILEESQYKYVKNRNFRGELITALLMIADELDLTRQRVDFRESSKFDLSPYCKVHWYKHYYVNSVNVIDKIIYIELVFPENSDKYQKLFENLIKQKLTDQLEKINPILSKSTKGLISFEGLIISSKIDPNIARLSFPKDALVELKKMVKIKPMPYKDAIQNYIHNS